MSENILSSSENFQARIVHDPFSEKPDGCWFGTVYSLATWVDSGSASILGQDSCVKTGFSVELASLWHLFRDMEVVESIFRDKVNVCDMCEQLIDRFGADIDGEVICDPDQEGAFHQPRYDFHENPIVGFNYLDRPNGKMVNIVTLEDLKHWGFESLEAYHALNSDKDPSDGNLDAWEAWADGDAYYVVIERKVAFHTEITTPEGDAIKPRETYEDWHEIDSLHGFYGFESAKEWAKESLASHEADGKLQGDFVCAECGRTGAGTFVVTVLDTEDGETTRTEVCRLCDDQLGHAD